nr:UDP-glucuronosyltransferase 2B31-like [Danaus plexippus plexippus]
MASILYIRGLCVYLYKSDINTSRILGVFPVPSLSHQIVFRKITQELHKRGHELTVLTPDPYKIEGLTFTYDMLRNMNPLFMKVIEYHFQSKEVQEIVANNKYDLILLESIVLSGLIYSHIFKAPVILVSSFGGYINEHKIMGTPTSPILYPLPLRNKIYNLNFFEKVREIYNHYSNEYAEYLNDLDRDKFLKESFGPQTPTMNELSDNIHMVFLNVHTIWADNKPTTPNILYLGGIHQVPQKKLPKDLEIYLNSSQHGVIYVSFGTNVLSNMISTDKIDNIVKVLSKLPYDVLWKWDGKELPGKSENIRISKWFPQSDLLRHPKIKLFITQAGLQSTDEAITAGVPLIAIPSFADQWYNAEKYEKFGIGIPLDIKTFTEEELHHAVITVINNESYRRNVIKLRETILDQPMSSIERAMWWTEYVLRHREKNHFRTLASNLSYMDYFDVKFWMTIFAIIGIFLTLFVVTIAYVIKLLNKMWIYNKVKTH